MTGILEQVRFSTFGNILLQGKMTWRDIRRKGLELAKENNTSVKVEVFNEYLNKWDFVGTDKPNGLTENFWGDITRVRADFSGYEIVHKHH